MKRTLAFHGATALRLAVAAVSLTACSAAYSAEWAFPEGSVGNEPAELADASVLQGVDAEEVALSYNEIEVVQERYPDGKLKTEREVTLDADANYVNHGAWKMYDPAGKIVAEGQFRMGQRVGQWIRWHSRQTAPELASPPFNQFQEPFVSQANFVDGLMDGEWIIHDARQRQCMQIAFKAGQRHGPALLWMPDGQILREANYDQGIPVGDVVRRARDGKVAEQSTYLDGRRVLTVTNNFPRIQNRKMSEAVYLDGRVSLTTPDDFWNVTFAQYDTVGEKMRHGTWRSWYDNGKLQMEGTYKQDREVGMFTWWHPNGQKAVEGEYTDGVKHGRWIWWHANGQKATQGRYERDAQIGLWRTWQQDGRLQQEARHDGRNAPVAVEPTPAELREPDVAQELPLLPWMQ